MAGSVKGLQALRGQRCLSVTMEAQAAGGSLEPDGTGKGSTGRTRRLAAAGSGGKLGGGEGLLELCGGPGLAPVSVGRGQQGIY